MYDVFSKNEIPIVLFSQLQENLKNHHYDCIPENSNVDSNVKNEHLNKRSCLKFWWNFPLLVLPFSQTWWLIWLWD
jgi:hypothetical protein